MQGQTNIVIFIILGCLAMLSLAIAITLFVVIYQRKMLEKENRIRQMEQEKQIALFKATVEAEELQKEKIARNLHDEINPILTILKLNMRKYRLQAQKNTFDPESLVDDSLLIDKTIEGIRSTCRDLIPSFLFQFGLIKALEDYARNINQTGTIETSFHNLIPEESVYQFSKQDELSIYRICLEIINNIFKHSKCKQLSIHASCADRLLSFTISHDGDGITNEEIDRLTESSRGLGLKSLKTRSLMLNAMIHYAKQPEMSSVRLHIPIPAIIRS